MRYMGSKAGISKEIAPLLMDGHGQDMLYIEPFVGGANMIDAIPASVRRIGYDVNPYLIALWRAVSNGWTPPETVTEQEYNDAKNNQDKDPVFSAWAGFACSFGGKWFGGYARGNKPDGTPRNHPEEAYRNAMKQFPALRGVQFQCRSVFDIELPGRATIYCDPPYAGTTKYRTGFDHDKFYDWCRFQAMSGHRVFVSEYAMPADFRVVWQKDVNCGLDSKRRVEKLFTL